VLCFFVHGWWLVLPLVGAIVLPYIAVVIANTASARGSVQVTRPSAALPAAPRRTENDA
jgi:hypothetical protein